MSHRRACLAASVLALALASGSHADVRPREPMDAAALQLALRRLQVLGSALYLAAHPDDENTALLTWLTQGRLVRAAYLSVTRGDGGQNLIGPETGELLGVLRTQELLAARRVDGAEQFFTRALDFGYSKTPEETMEIWGREQILGDIVRVIREFRPDVVITRFPTDGGGGHGHHTASALLAEEAFDAAADPRRFPEQLGTLAPWRAKRLLWNAWRPDTSRREGQAPRLRVDLGSYNPLLGRAYTEIAGQSRSMHKSQGFGAPERRGSIPNEFEQRKGEPAREDMFDGVDLSWSRVPGGEKVGRLLADAERAFRPDAPEATLPVLLRAHAALAALPDGPWVTRKREELLEVIRSCAGVWTEAIASVPAAAPGGSVKVTASILNRSKAPWTLEGVEMPFEARARLAGAPAESSAELRGRALEPNRPVAAEATVTLPADLPLTQPYWLRERPDKGAFTLPAGSPAHAPENAPPLVARFALRAGSERLVIEAPVVYRWTDPVAGERYRPFEVAPPVTARFDQGVYLFPAGGREKEVRVVLQAGDGPVQGALRLEAPRGFRVEPAEARFDLSGKSAATPIRFTVTPAAGSASGMIAARIESGGRRFSHRMVRMDYPHVPIQTLFPPAEARAMVADVRCAAGAVGYVMGSGDAGPEALRQMGCRVALLTDEELESAELARHDAVVVGVRAYNTRPRLRALQPRLLDYVRGGGTLVVQYQTADAEIQDKLGPYPFKVSRDRVTVEEAAVSFVRDAHPLLVWPNRIGPADFEGWVQERGLYFANPWDPRYETPLACNDPGEPPREGGLLFAREGKGAYVYTGYAFFRQLPAGVPGAWRLFANLVSAGAARTAGARASP